MEGEKPIPTVVAPSNRLAARTVKHQAKEVVNVGVYAPLCPLGPPTDAFVTSRHQALFQLLPSVSVDSTSTLRKTSGSTLAVGLHLWSSLAPPCSEAFHLLH